MDDIAIFGQLAELIHNPFFLAIELIVATFILEDAATISGAILASETSISPLFILTFLYIGIIVGDILLYMLGYSARTLAWSRQLLERKHVQLTQDFLHNNLIKTVILARFIPGMRLPTYSILGFVKGNFLLFVLATAGASTIWTSALFAITYYFGQVFFETLGGWRWVIIVGVLLAFMIIPKLLYKRRTPKDST